MGNIKKISIAAMIVMAAVSFSNLLGVTAAGIAVFIGVIFFFVDKAIDRQGFAGSGLDFKAIGKELKKGSVWFWIAMPVIMDAVSIGLSMLFLPDYVSYTLNRAGNFVSYESGAVLFVIQLIVLALGEEIAWRAFFQRQLQKKLTVVPVLAVSSAFFALGHIASGSLYLVAYDVVFVFINSILYGVIFHKTGNAWISTISHFAANLFSFIVMMNL